MLQSTLELALKPHIANYTMYLNNSCRKSGPIRITAPFFFNNDGEFDLTNTKNGKELMLLQNDVNKLIDLVYKENCEGKDYKEIYKDVAPWELNGFFTKGVGMGWHLLADTLKNQHNGYLMDSLFGIPGKESLCFIEAEDKIQYVEDYLAHQFKHKPKIVRIVISSQVKEDVIAVYPYYKHRFKYEPAYYYRNDGINRMPAVIDFPSKKRISRKATQEDLVNFPTTADDFAKTAEKMGSKVLNIECKEWK